jgi:hypothetical protein
VQTSLCDRREPANASSLYLAVLIGQDSCFVFDIVADSQFILAFAPIRNSVRVEGCNSSALKMLTEASINCCRTVTSRCKRCARTNAVEVMDQPTSRVRQCLPTSSAIRRAPRFVDNRAGGTAAGVIIAVGKAGRDVLRHAVRLPVTERYEHDPVKGERTLSRMRYRDW